MRRVWRSIALTNGEAVTVNEDPWLTFTPVAASTTGFIFYPGARVHPESYAPAARAIAEQGYLVVVVPMPLNLAVLSPNRAEKVLDVHSEIETWAIGGHSLGGAMAAHFADTHRNAIQGLALWGAYAGAKTSLRDAAKDVLVVYGTRDCIATPEEVLGGALRLPADATLVPVVGGNHMQFGWYDGQRGSCEATVSLEEQQSIVVAATLDLLDKLAR